jgi:hypothetical protein
LRIRRIQLRAFPFPAPRPLIGDAQTDARPVLLAPLGQLSGDGQLRELMEERRDRHDGTGPIWYIQPDQVAALGLGQGRAEEGVATTSAAVLTWLQLRFGGRISAAAIPTEWLEAEARALPPGAGLLPLA